MKRKKRSKGFTLVELLVAIAIIGILAGVVLVSLSSQRTRARNSSALQSVTSAFPLVVSCLLSGHNAYVDINDRSKLCLLSGSYAGGTFEAVQWPDLANTGCYYISRQFLMQNTWYSVAVGCSDGAVVECNPNSGGCRLQ